MNRLLGSVEPYSTDPGTNVTLVVSSRAATEV